MRRLDGWRIPNVSRWLLPVVLMAVIMGYGGASSAGKSDPEPDRLAGAWRSRVQFSSGVLASAKNLEFMVAFNAGGTMTESSNYDGAPPVPPAYGIWRSVGPRQFEARYEFYFPKSPEQFAEIAMGGGWLPKGRGVLTETISLAEDGNSYTSTLVLAMFDETGAPMEGGCEGTGTGTRMVF